MVAARKWIRVTARGAPEPILENRALPRSSASPSSSTRHSSTSTPARVAPAAPSNVAWNCSKMAVVNVAKRNIANAPYSASRCTPISSPPPSTASRSCGNTTRKKMPTVPEPSARADSSMEGSSRRRVAAAGRKTNGKYDNVLTNTPAPNPCSVGHTPTQA